MDQAYGEYAAMRDCKESGKNLMSRIWAHYSNPYFYVPLAMILLNLIYVIEYGDRYHPL